MTLFPPGVRVSDMLQAACDQYLSPEENMLISLAIQVDGPTYKLLMINAVANVPITTEQFALEALRVATLVLAGRGPVGGDGPR